MKTCNNIGCSNPVFGGGYCGFHQYKRTDKPKRSLKRSPVKKVSDRRQSVSNKDWVVYDELWATRPHICEECNTRLGDTPIKHFFSHILAKGAHPAMRHDIDNFNILCFECHHVWEFGNRMMMMLWNKNSAIILTLKQRYYAKD